MARHTIGTKRGSVRGAPPSVYIPFGSFGDDDDDAPWEEALDFCKGLLGISVFFLFALFVCVLWYAFTSEGYSN